MKQFFILFAVFLLTVSCTKENKHSEYTYQIASSAWNEALGNHRAVLQVATPADAVDLSFKWRRPDKDVDQRRFLIVNAQTGDTIRNINRTEVNPEICNITFGPVSEKGTYYFYYLPYEVQLGHGFYGQDYEQKEDAPDQAWLANAPAAGARPLAAITCVESRTAFDSFYPMEITAAAAEKEQYRKDNSASFWIFPEDRMYPVRMKKEIPYKWLQMLPGTAFKGSAMPNEYYTFQLAIWSGQQEVKNVKYSTNGLSDGKNTIPATAFTCFNTEGVDPYGTAFSPVVSVSPNTVQPLWFGIDVAQTQPSGTYKGSVEITSEEGDVFSVPIELKVTGKVIADRGDSEPWRHSRLRWLNSSLGISDKPTEGYEAMRVNDEQISCLGRTVSVSTSTALPQTITAWDTQLLSAPVRFVVQTASGVKNLNGQMQLTTQNEGKVSGKWIAQDEDLTLSCTATMEFDGWINYIYTVTPKKEIAIKDIRLEIPLKSEESPYFMGMGLPGQETPRSYSGKWNTPETTVNNFGVSIPVSKQAQWLWPFDSFWLGSERAGIHCELRGTSYSGPLLNLYRPSYPVSWYNEGKGGFRVERNASQTQATVYSGARTLKAQETLLFDFAFLITPVKPVNYKSQFTDHYYHNGGKPTPTDQDVAAGVNIINVHHANYLNPFINYPFLTVDKMKSFTDEWHQKDCKIKIYYTIRELTNAVTEIWALRSLGSEILRGGNGGGFPWCREHYVSDYTPQWYQHFEEPVDGIEADASVLTATGDSRWYNYYIEGLAWLVKNVGIDGIYLDDVAFDRRIMKRIRRAMDSVKPGCIIDLHSNTGFSKGPAMQYAEYFPYVDKLWFGESFMYNQMQPVNWLVEVSGIPFGHMGDMLHGGGNRWLGMQYGMTVRHPWITEGVLCDPRPIWKATKEFGIADSRMIGFWEKQVPVKTTDPDVKVTSYVKAGKTLLSIGNYASTPKLVSLEIDWKQLNLDPAKVKIEAPAIADFQEAKTFSVNEPIPVKNKEGWLLILSE